MLNVLVSISTICQATTIVRIGVQEFEDGDIVTKEQFTASYDTEPYKINVALGNDNYQYHRAGGSWLFNYEGEYRSAIIRMGLWEHDSAKSFDQVNFCYVNDHDCAEELNLILNSHGGEQLEYNVYSLELAALTPTELSKGVVFLRLGLGNGAGSIQGLPGGNFGGFDFFELHLVEIPEPSSLGLMAILLVSCCLHRAHSRRYQGQKR